MIVTFASVTVGVLVPEPIVTTGPPPLIVIAAAATPNKLTLLAIVTPPANVPCPTLIVSPS